MIIHALVIAIYAVLAHRILEVFPSIALITWVLVSAKIHTAARTALWGVLAAGIAFVVVGVALARRHEQGGAEEKGRFGGLLARAREGLGITPTVGADMQCTQVQ